MRMYDGFDDKVGGVLYPKGIDNRLLGPIPRLPTRVALLKRLHGTLCDRTFTCHPATRCLPGLTSTAAVDLDSSISAMSRGALI